MKKHNLIMVFLLILSLSLVGVVSASDNVTVCDNALPLESCGENQMEIAVDCEISDVSLDNDDSDIIISSDDGSCDESEDICTRQLDSNYELGYEITKDFTDACDIDLNGEVLVISNAGISDINNQTTESVLNGIIDASNGYITYEDGNVISLSSTADSVYVAFFVKNNESFTIALYKNNANPLYYGNVGPRISVGHLEKLKLSDVETASILSVIDGWTNEDSNLLSYKTDTSNGFLGGKDKLQAVKNYPHEFDLPLVDVLGISRDFDDDAFILEKSNSSDEMASFDVSMVGKSMEEFSSLNLYQIGVDASNDAISYLKSHGVDIPNDYPYLYVLTSAGHVKVDGFKTDKVLDGILDALGPKFNEKHLISVVDPSWKDLVFYFIVVKNTKYTSYALKYDSDTGKLCESDKAKEHGDNVAKNRGLISTNHKYYGSSKISHRIVSSVSARDLNQSSINITDKKIPADNKTAEDNVTNISQNNNKSDKIVDVPAKSNANPFNILYTLASILIVCVIFGRNYRKR